MAWKSKKFKVVKIVTAGLEKGLEIHSGGFDTYEEAESDLLRLAPLNIENYTILPIYTFEPNRFE